MTLPRPAGLPKPRLAEGKPDDRQQNPQHHPDRQRHHCELAHLEPPSPEFFSVGVGEKDIAGLTTRPGRDVSWLTDLRRQAKAVAEGFSVHQAPGTEALRPPGQWPKAPAPPCRRHRHCGCP